MKKTEIPKKNRGFTVVEMLAVVAIIVILLGISAVGVVYYRDYLKITELDNAAREIYMAAENRAVLLSGGKRLSGLVQGGSPVQLSGGGAAGEDAPDTAYAIRSSESDKIEKLLPAGSIDPTLLDGDFYIVYEPLSGSVTDVFYAEEKFDALMEGSVGSFYAKWSTAGRQARMKAEPVLGYYGGGVSEGRDSDVASTPQIMVEIKNEERLTVEVRYWLPNEIPDHKVKLALTIQLEGGGSVSLDGSGGRLLEQKQEQDPFGKGSNYIRTWVLDELEPGAPGKETYQFKGLFSAAPSLGGKFTAQAALTSDDGAFQELKASDDNNSLFAEGSDADTAYIKNLRHLQNLDQTFSGVSGKSKAEQTSHIVCSGAENQAYPDYKFKPIENHALTSYTVSGEGGEAFEIRSLRVTAESAAGKPAAGLFAAGGGMGGGIAFSSVHLIDGEIYAPGQAAGTLLGKGDKVKLTGCLVENCTVTGGTAAGGLAGNASNATLTDCLAKNCTVTAGTAAGGLAGDVSGSTLSGCQVYWEDEGQPDLTRLLGSDAAGCNYQIKGQNAGGMLGSVKSTEITNSFAATLVSGENAGGMAGYGAGLTVKNSYADCYVQGAENAAGLVGRNEGAGTTAALTLENVYTAGFLDGNNSAAGLAGISNTNGTMKGGNVYSVMVYSNPGADAAYTFGVPENGDLAKNCWYMDPGIETDQSGKRSYEEMAAEAFQKTMGAAFAKKPASESNPYNLRKNWKLTEYSFPGLNDLPHYGDWGAQFKASLVYYEKYTDGSHGFSGGNARYLEGIGELSGKDVVVSDGYAVAFRESDLAPFQVELKDITLNLRCEDSQGASWTAGEELAASKWEGETYVLVKLPEGLVNSGNADQGFFQYLKCDLTFLKGSETLNIASGEFLYNPHFAETVSPYTRGTKNEAQIAADAGQLLQVRSVVSVRSPRHLYELSNHAEYYHNGRKLTFVQELNLDYSRYQGYNLFDAKKNGAYEQKPIGKSMNDAFVGTYNGQSNTIRGVNFGYAERPGYVYAGLFGVSSGSLRNIVYIQNEGGNAQVLFEHNLEPGANLYGGALVGLNNGGTVENCAVAGVNMKLGLFGASAAYVGGLAGVNDGVIRDCAAEAAEISSDNTGFSRGWLGGLVGQNRQNIDTSYAVGRISAEVERTSQAVVCGFAGENQKSIQNCYAALDLSTQGTSTEVYGFAGPGGVRSGCFFLNGENYTYRGKSYGASYEGPEIEQLTYKKLSDASSPVGGMGKAADGLYPYPTAVAGHEGNTHYGQWPSPMKLGEMGVYYWEKLEKDGASDYYVNLLAVFQEEGKDGVDRIERKDTLLYGYNDGGVVTDYGYGYYNTKPPEENPGSGLEVVLSAENILYTADGKTGGKYSRENPWPSDPSVDAALQAQMPSWEFHSYHSFIPEFGPAGGTKTPMAPGLYPVKNNSGPNGAMTLTQGAIKVSFHVNPHFASAITVDNPGKDWNITDNSLTLGLGSAKKNETKYLPYGVRSVAQLEMINWNISTLNTSTVIQGKNNHIQYPYLSTSGTTGKYFWEQTHDLDGKSRTYTPIAEYYDTSSGGEGDLYGWFGGSYNGQDYVIKNVSIQGQESSCAGLFGVVYNGTLERIILYDAGGDGTIKSYNGSVSESRWYAIGALAGVVAVDKKDESLGAVKNCAAGGYTITADIRINQGGWGGSGIGGLVGISDMKLSGCSAVTSITVPKTSISNDNTRIGGLVGACQQSITNCYAGGEIKVEPGVSVGQKGIYIGGIVGGSYMKPMRVAGDSGKTIGFINDGDGATSNSLENCYSFVTLPDAAAVNGSAKSYVDHKIRALYALGGTGEINETSDLDRKYEYANLGYVARNHGVCTIKNCFYLEDIVFQNNRTEDAVLKTDRNNAAVASLNYLQLAGREKVTVNKKEYDDIYELLTGFSRVTTKGAGGFEVSGKYSFPPSSRADLLGMDYPFPTILTRGGKDVHVHYGQWPVFGIERAKGGEPIRMDIFSRPSHTETLALSAGLTAKTWSVTPEAVLSGDEDAVLDSDGNRLEKVRKLTAQIIPGADGKTAVLKVEAGMECSVELTVSCTATDGKNYSLKIRVNVSQNLSLTPGSACIFPGDILELPLEPYSRPPEGEQAAAQPAAEKLTIMDIGSTGGLTCSVLRDVQNAVGEPPCVRVAANNSLTAGAPAMVNVEIAYRHTVTADGQEKEALYQRDCPVELRVLAPPEPVFQESEIAAERAYCLDFEQLQESIGGIKAMRAEVAAQPASGVRFTAAVKDKAVFIRPENSSAWEAEHPIPEITLRIELDMASGQKHTVLLPLKPGE